MKLQFPPEVEEFRAEFSAWLDQNTPSAEESTERATSSGEDFGTSRPAVMSVSMNPTWTATTWVRWASNSSRIEFVSDLPRTPSGKVLKRELRERFGSPAA